MTGDRSITHTTTRLRLGALAVLAALVAAGCGGETDTASAADTAPAQAETSDACKVPGTLHREWLISLGLREP